jgi:hypothetical protein
MTFRAWCIVATIALLGGIAPATSAAPTRATDASITKKITLPFEPPIDVPLRYAFEMRSGNAGRQQIVKSLDELTYSRVDNGGYLLRWITKSIDVEAPGPMQAVLRKVYSTSINNPMIIAVSPQGFAQALVNEAEVRTLTDSMMTNLVGSMDAEFATLPPEARATMSRMMQALVDQQRKQSSEAFSNSALESPRMMLRNIPPMPPGQPIASAFEAPSPIGTGTVRFLAQSELRRYDPGKEAEVVLSSTVSPEDVERITKEIAQAMLAAISDPAARKAAEAKIAAMPAMSISEEAVMVVDLPSGMTRSIRYSKAIAIPGQSPRTDSRSYTRIP